MAGWGCPALPGITRWPPSLPGWDQKSTAATHTKQLVKLGSQRVQENISTFNHVLLCANFKS